MKIDLIHTLYTAGMIILAFVSALVVTKTVSNYLSKKKCDDEENR
jgi:hypothetical protein